MKRDMDLIRHILASVERAEQPVDMVQFLCDGHDTIADIGYHVELMAAHGLIDASLTRDMNDEVVGGV